MTRSPSSHTRVIRNNRECGNTSTRVDDMCVSGPVDDLPKIRIKKKPAGNIDMKRYSRREGW